MTGWLCCRLALVIVLSALPALASTADSQPERRARFLTAPSQGDPLEVTLQYIHQDKARLLVETEDLTEWVVRDRYVTSHNQTTHLYLRQRFRGIEVFNADISAAVDRQGRMLGLHSRFVHRLARSVNATEPSISATDAVTAAAEHLGLDIREPLQTRSVVGGAPREVRIGAAGISLDEIPARLMYLPREGGAVRLVWNVVLRPEDGRHWWNVHVDALTGVVLWKNDWIANDSYRVYALPLSSPDEGARTLEVDPANPIASPFGWHDTDGAAGPESTDTAGNNVLAQEDGEGDQRVFPAA